MKHTSRKKMLLSSIAMLLVALVALGSATYAWFTADPTADAKGLHMYTQAGTGLLVLSETEEAKGGDFSHHTFLNASAVGTASTVPVQLQPASLSNSDKSGVAEDQRAAFGTFYTTTAKSDAAYGQDETKAITSAAATAYYDEEIKVKVTGGAAQANLNLKGVKWTATGDNLAAAVRVAVTDTDGKLIAIFAPTAATNGYLASTTYAQTNPTYTATTKGTCDLAAGVAKNDGSTAIHVYVYLDGEDSACFSLNVSATLAEIMQNLEVDLDVTTA